MGTGTTISFVDLPIAREKHTGYPIMPASGIKGVIRDFARRQWKDDEKKVELIFGPEEKPEDFASCLTFTDGRILLLPVRSLKGIFAWVTSPFILKRLAKDVAIADSGSNLPLEELQISDEDVLVCSNSKIVFRGKVVLEDYELNAKEDASTIADTLYSLLMKGFSSSSISSLLSTLAEKFAIVSDDAFSEISTAAMEIATRIKIDHTKGTVEEGALFTEEAVPSESIFYNLALFTKPNIESEKLKSAEDVMKEIKELLKGNPLIQFGGDATLGRGLARIGLV
jgi:CRISPR-associated protein Cmr4